MICFIVIFFIYNRAPLVTSSYDCKLFCLTLRPSGFFYHPERLPVRTSTNRFAFKLNSTYFANFVVELQDHSLYSGFQYILKVAIYHVALKA